MDDTKIQPFNDRDLIHSSVVEEVAGTLLMVAVAPHTGSVG